MLLDGYPFYGVFIADNGVIEQDIAQQKQKIMLENDTYENRRSYGQALHNWASATNRKKTSRAWKYAELLKDSATQSNNDAVEGSNG